MPAAVLAIAFLLGLLGDVPLPDPLRLARTLGHPAVAARSLDDSSSTAFRLLDIAPVAAPLMTGAALAGVYVQRQRILRRLRRSHRRRGKRIVRRMMA